MDPQQINNSYIFVGTTSVYIWDTLCHLKDEYVLVTSHRIGIPTIVYFVSRVSTLLYLIGSTVTRTTPLDHCNLAIRLATSPLVLSLSASELLLFLHVRAVYVAERVVVWFFVALWMLTVASAVFAIVAISGTSVGSTKYCVPVVPARVGITMIGIHMFNDTLLFTALVAFILRTSDQDPEESPLKESMKTTLLGAHVPRLAKALLHNGQQYFLATVLVHIAALIMYYIDIRNASLGFPSVMLMNVMASRLYRRTKLAPLHDHIVSFKLTNSPADARGIVFADKSSSLDRGVEPCRTACEP